MFTKLLPLIALALFVVGCTTAGVIPPQDVSLDPEPRSMYLSEMAAELGWTYESGPEPRQYTLKSPKGDRVTFKGGSDLVFVNTTRWKAERDAVENRNGNDLYLPESVFNWVCKRFGQHHLMRGPIRQSTVDLTPLTPDAPVTPVPGNGPLKGLTICVDAGHGGRDPGGMANGVVEKDICLNVSLRLRDLLVASGASVIMTRTTDVYPELEDRCTMANKGNADLFISVHANIAPNSDEVAGIEAFFKGGKSDSERFARVLVEAMVGASGAPSRGAKVDPRGLRVLEKTNMTAVLVELGFMSNPEEARKLGTRSYQDLMAKALHDGVVKYWTRNRASVSK